MTGSSTADFRFEGFGTYARAKGLEGIQEMTPQKNAKKLDKALTKMFQKFSANCDAVGSLLRDYRK